jgi:hypothetical protein
MIGVVYGVGTLSYGALDDVVFFRLMIIVMNPLFGGTACRLCSRKTSQTSSFSWTVVRRLLVRLAVLGLASLKSLQRAALRLPHPVLDVTRLQEISSRNSPNHAMDLHFQPQCFTRNFSLESSTGNLEARAPPKRKKCDQRLCIYSCRPIISDEVSN